MTCTKKPVICDAEGLMSKADSLKSDISIQKEKVRMAEAQVNNNFQNFPQPVHNNNNTRTSNKPNL